MSLDRSLQPRARRAARPTSLTGSGRCRPRCGPPRPTSSMASTASWDPWPSASRRRSAISMMRRSTRPKTLDAGKRPLASRSPAGSARQDLDALRAPSRPRRGGTAPLRDRLGDVVAQDEVRQVRARHEHALRAREAARLAQVEEALDLRAHAADRLHLAELVHAARHGDALVDPHVGEGAEDREELARARAVAVDLAVALLERELRAEAQRPLLPEHAREVAAQDRDALGVDRSRRAAPRARRRRCPRARCRRPP